MARNIQRCEAKHSESKTGNEKRWHKRNRNGEKAIPPERRDWLFGKRTEGLQWDLTCYQRHAGGRWRSSYVLRVDALTQMTPYIDAQRHSIVCPRPVQKWTGNLGLTEAEIGQEGIATP